MDASEYLPLRAAVEKLTLNDSSVAVHPDSSVALGQGWRLGFLGLLHMDVFRQRLEEVRYVDRQDMFMGFEMICIVFLISRPSFYSGKMPDISLGRVTDIEHVKKCCCRVV